MKSIIFLFVTFVGSVAFANNSQFFFQADKGEVVLTPGVGFGFSGFETRFNNAVARSSTSSVTVRGSFEYGLAERWSLGGVLGYSNSDTRSSSFGSSGGSVTAGLSDPSIFVKSYSQFSNVTIWYGGSYSFSVEDSKPGNQSSGRNEVMVYVGADAMIAKRHRVGGRISQGFLLGEQEVFDNQGNSSRFTGGESTRVDAYYEYIYNKGLVGSNLFFSDTSDRKNKRTGARSSFVSIYGYQFFANFHMSDKWTLIPDLTVATTLENESSGVEIEKYIIFATGVSARYTF